MSFWKRLALGCWFSHSLLRERRGKSYVLTCEVCGFEAKFPKQKLRLIRRLPVTRTKVQKFEKKIS